MNKKIYPLRQEGNPEQTLTLKRRHTKKESQVRDDAAACSCSNASKDYLDFLCDCGEPVSPVKFIGLDHDGIRLRARCLVCGQKYVFKLKVNFPSASAQLDDFNSSEYKIINRLRLKEI
jgi:hypothetical protein